MSIRASPFTLGRRPSISIPNSPAFELPIDLSLRQSICSSRPETLSEASDVIRHLESELALSKDRLAQEIRDRDRERLQSENERISSRHLAETIERRQSQEGMEAFQRGFRLLRSSWSARLQRNALMAGTITLLMFTGIGCAVLYTAAASMVASAVAAIGVIGCAVACFISHRASGYHYEPAAATDVCAASPYRESAWPVDDADAI